MIEDVFSLKDNLQIFKKIDWLENQTQGRVVWNDSEGQDVGLQPFHEAPSKVLMWNHLNIFHSTHWNLCLQSGHAPKPLLLTGVWSLADEFAAHAYLNAFSLDRRCQVTASSLCSWSVLDTTSDAQGGVACWGPQDDRFQKEHVSGVGTAHSKRKTLGQWTDM